VLLLSASTSQSFFATTLRTRTNDTTKSTTKKRAKTSLTDQECIFLFNGIKFIFLFLFFFKILKNILKYLKVLLNNIIKLYTKLIKIVQFDRKV